MSVAYGHAALLSGRGVALIGADYKKTAVPALVVLRGIIDTIASADVARYDLNATQVMTAIEKDELLREFLEVMANVHTEVNRDDARYSLPAMKEKISQHFQSNTPSRVAHSASKSIHGIRMHAVSKRRKVDNDENPFSTVVTLEETRMNSHSDKHFLREAAMAVDLAHTLSSDTSGKLFKHTDDDKIYLAFTEERHICLETGDLKDAEEGNGQTVSETEATLFAPCIALALLNAKTDEDTDEDTALVKTALYNMASKAAGKLIRKALHSPVFSWDKEVDDEYMVASAQVMGGANLVLKPDTTKLTRGLGFGMSRPVMITTDDNIIGRTFTIEGKSLNGDAQTNTITGLNSDSGTTDDYFSEITKISVDDGDPVIVKAGWANIQRDPTLYHAVPAADQQGRYDEVFEFDQHDKWSIGYSPSLATDAMEALLCLGEPD